MADYMDRVENFPVKSQVNPREILDKLPADPPQKGEPFRAIFEDFQNIIMPGVTHWQHPSFFAYFPANSSPPSLLGEMLMSTLGAQCMSWQTSPAATELEERMIEWLGQMIGLPTEFTGVIQDTASTATLCSILTAREKASQFAINKTGFTGPENYAVYCSSETHSSIEKGVRIAGLGSENIRKVEVDSNYAMIAEALQSAIENDLNGGATPVCVVATLGTTGSTAIDPLREIGQICQRYGVWLHVDAAYAGTSLTLPEMRWISDGVEFADTFVFNPHKWMFTNFDCSAYFVKDAGALTRTFEILPEYLKTSEGDSVRNYRDWGIQLGRRFRALKLWFVIRSYGVDGIRSMIRSHISLAKELADKIEHTEGFELLAPVPLNLICFRYRPKGIGKAKDLNKLNVTLLEELNRTGKLYITHTMLHDVYSLRLVIGQTNVKQKHVDDAWELIQSTARQVSLKH